MSAIEHARLTEAAAAQGMRPPEFIRGLTRIAMGTIPVARVPEPPLRHGPR